MASVGKTLTIGSGAICRTLPSPIREEEIHIKYDVAMTSLAASMPSNAFRWLSENREKKSRREFSRSQSASVDSRLTLPGAERHHTKAEPPVQRQNSSTAVHPTLSPVKGQPGRLSAANSPCKSPRVLNFLSSTNFRWSDTQLSPTQPEKDFATSPKTHRSRNEQFNRVFPDIKDTVINSYHCALLDDILFQGILYVTKNWFCFHCKLLGKKLIRIRVSSVTDIVKMNTALIIPNAVGIYTDKDKFVFGSLMARRNTYQVLMKVWQETAACTLASGQVDITNNNNNPQTACRHSRNSSETTNPTTSASDDLSCSPDHPLDDHSKQSTDDDYDSEPDQPDGHQCNRCPDDTRNEAAADRRSTGPLSPSDSAAATTDLQPPAPPCRKRRGAQQQQQQLDGVSSPSGSFRDSASSINDSAAKAGAWTNGSQDSTGSRSSSTARCIPLITAMVILLMISAVFMAFKLVHIQAQHDAYSALYAAEKQDNSATSISGEEIYRLRHERHKTVVERLHAMTETHVQLLDKVKKSLQELSDMAERHRYQSLGDDFDELDKIVGVTPTVNEGDDNQHGST